MFKTNRLVAMVLVIVFSVLIIGCSGADSDGVKTEIIKVYGYDWTLSGSTYMVVKTSDILTQDIIDNGSAHLYLEAGEDIWMALPYLTMGYIVALNEIGIMTEGSVTSSTNTFKLVVIEGTMQTETSGVDFNNYNEVKEYFNLND